jgi:hypothetical protein
MALSIMREILVTTPASSIIEGIVANFNLPSLLI